MMSALEDKLTSISCECDCDVYKPTFFTYAMNLTTTRDLECIFQLIIAFILIIIYFVGSTKMKLSYQKSFQIYYLLIMLIYLCHTIYSLLSCWLAPKYFDKNKIFFNQKISFYLVDQGDILLNSFYLSFACEKFQDFDEFFCQRLSAKFIKICNIIYTLSFTIWLLVVVFYYNLCFEHFESYQILQLTFTTIFSFFTIIILCFYVRYRRNQVDGLSNLKPLIIFIIILFIGSLIEIVALILRYMAPDWLSNFKYGKSKKEIKEQFDDIVKFILQNTTNYAIYDFILYLFTVCSPLALFVYMYSNIRRNRMVETID